MFVRSTENKSHKTFFGGVYGFMGLMRISITNKPSCLDKRRLIRNLLAGIIVSLSKPNRP
jgi:hypothetical protein